MSIPLHRIAATILVVVSFLYSSNAKAAPDEGTHALAEKIAKAHRSGQHFAEAMLFAPASAPRHTGILDEETALQPLPATISGLFTTHPGAVSVTVSTETGKSYTLEMLRSYVSGDHPDMGVYDAAGRHATAYTAGLHYQGAVAGDPHSLAAMSVFANGEVVMLFANEEGNFVIGKLEDGSGKYIFYNDRNLHGRSPAPCATLDPPAGVTAQEGIRNGKAAKALLCNKVRFYWEVAYQFYTYKGSNVTTVQNYATALFNQFQAMYANEKIAVELASMYVWTTADGYPVTSSSTALSAFRTYWNGLSSGYNGNLAHLLTRTTNNNLGGIAYLNGLCNQSYSYAFSDISGTFQTIPTWSWDVEVMTHETGHNLGSSHTHWCGWGTAGACGAIDNCYTLESSTGCSTCSYQYDNSASTTAWKGTVMSYCHLVARGINLANGFGPLPGGAIRTYVGNAACLNAILNVQLSPAPICNADGGVTLTFASNNFGTAPYTYSWSTGAQTQNLANITNTGTYAVTVTDSNGCTASAAANVDYALSSGNGIKPAVQMPICCNSYNAPLVLNANVPQGLSSCNTVYWLRSNAVLSTTADAQAYLDTTSAQNILKSTNESSIANGTTGASLSITPASCNTTQTWYYTPVVVTLPHTADSFSYATTGSTAFMSYNSTQIGAYTNIPAQYGIPTACDLLDTPTAQTLTATVTNYTGRANKMRIIVRDSNNTVLYQSPAYAGNGTYSIPASSIPGNFLQSLQVLVMDYNCTVSGSSATCTSSQASVTATRKVVFGTQRPLKVANGCPLSPSLRVDFAPAGCTRLAVQAAVLANSLSLVPNPATNAVTMKFNLQQPAQVQWKLCDMAGRIILNGNSAYGAGAHEAQINLHEIARGIYFVNLSDGRGASERVKLVVQ
jgi:hypothetical protein